jgi:hypothetical protein
MTRDLGSAPVNLVGRRMMGPAKKEDRMSLAMTRQEREAFLAAVHVGIISIAEDGRGPRLGEPVLTVRYQLIRYHRRGFAGRTHPDGPLSLVQQAADRDAFMRHPGMP